MTDQERPECDFGQLNLFATEVYCRECGHEALTPVYKETGKERMAFCSEQHATDFYCSRLRRGL